MTGVGGLSWYITLVSNTDRVKESPDTWTAFWDPQWKNELALLRNAANSFLLEITADVLTSTATTSSRRRTASSR